MRRAGFFRKGKREEELGPRGVKKERKSFEFLLVLKAGNLRV